MIREDFDFTAQGRRPTAAQIVKAWRDAGKPQHFGVTYGETFAEFEYGSSWGPARWQDSGNGCRGVQRDKVVAALAIATHSGDKARYEEREALDDGARMNFGDGPYQG